MDLSDAKSLLESALVNEYTVLTDGIELAETIESGAYLFRYYC